MQTSGMLFIFRGNEKTSWLPHFSPLKEIFSAPLIQSVSHLGELDFLLSDLQRITAGNGCLEESIDCNTSSSAESKDTPPSIASGPVDPAPSYVHVYDFTKAAQVKPSR